MRGWSSPVNTSTSRSATVPCARSSPPRSAEGAWPGIVFYTDIFQLTEASLRWAVRLAGYGFLVAVPEIYHRVEPPGTVLGFDDEGKARGQADVEAITTAEFDEDIAAAISWLAARGRAGRRRRPLHGRAPRRSAPRSTRAWTAPRCWYPTGLHDGKLGKDVSDSLQRAGEIERRAAADLRHARPAHAAAAAATTVQRRRSTRRARATSGTSTTPSTPSGATSARASTPRPPTARSPRRSRSSGGCCDEALRPPDVGELPQGAHPAARSSASSTSACTSTSSTATAHGQQRAQPDRARAGAGDRRRRRSSPSPARSCCSWPRARRSCRSPAWTRARVHQWLFFEQNQVEPGLAVARFMALVGLGDDAPEVFADRLAQGRRALEALAARARRRAAVPRRRGLQRRRHPGVRVRALRGRRRARPARGR